MQVGAKLSASDLVKPDPPDLLGRIAARQIDFVEIAWGDDRSLDQLARAASTVLDSPLGLSIHPYLHQKLAPEIFNHRHPDIGHRELADLLVCLADRASQPVTAVFHAGLARLAPHFRPLVPARMAAERFFRFYADRARQSSNLTILPETQMPIQPDYRSEVRIGDTWESCLELADEANTQLGWDVGHTHLACCMKKHAQHPPVAFLEAVGHVHAHDWLYPIDQICDEVMDHRPLGRGSGIWEHLLVILAQFGYDRRILLEISLESLADLGEYLDMLYDGARRLRELFARHCPRDQ